VSRTRTHLMLDMNLGRDGKGTSTSMKFGTTGGGGTGAPKVKFSLFGKPKRPLIPKEDRLSRSSTLRTLAGSGIPDPMPPAAQPAPAPAKERPSGDPVTLQTLKQDCLMVPIAKMPYFYPAGFEIPSPSSPGTLGLLEAPPPHHVLVYHLLSPSEPLLPAVQSPLHDPHRHQRECVLKAFKTAAGVANCRQMQGMVLMNLERECEEGKVEFAFILVWVMDARVEEPGGIISRVRRATMEALDPATTGFTCRHHFNTYQEVATIARPPLEQLQRVAGNSNTGYIVALFQVFQGDDGTKFERNWLKWTGAQTLYRSLQHSPMELRRITLAKALPDKGVVRYALVCDGSNFLSHVARAVQAVPMLRMRLCGDIGLYRPIATF